MASPDGKEGSVTLHQEMPDSTVRFCRRDKTVNYENPEGRYVWIQVAKGQGFLVWKANRARDGVSVTGRETLKLEGETQSEFLLFDLP